MARDSTNKRPRPRRWLIFLSVLVLLAAGGSIYVGLFLERPTDQSAATEERVSLAASPQTVSVPPFHLHDTKDVSVSSCVRLVADVVLESPGSLTTEQLMNMARQVVADITQTNEVNGIRISFWNSPEDITDGAVIASVDWAPEGEWDKANTVATGSHEKHSYHIAFNLTTQDETAPSTPTPIGNEVGLTAPEFTLQALDGESVSFSDYRGHVVILVFWASWCPSCRASMPALEGLIERYHDEGLVIVGVSLDCDAEDATTYLEENGYGEMIALWESLSASEEVALLYGVSTIPHTFVVDPSGIIRYSGDPAYLIAAVIEPWL